MARISIKSLWQSTSRCRLVLLFAAIALAVFFTHVQNYMPISRFQHYGLSLLIFGCGWLLETLLSYKKLNKWARMSYVSTCLYFLTIGGVYFGNAWLGHRISIATEDNMRTERILMITYFIFSMYLAGVWTKWVVEETKNRPNSVQSSKTGS